MATNEPPFSDASSAWLEFAQRMSLPDEPDGHVPSASWMEPAPVEDSTIGPRKVAVALKVTGLLYVCAAVQVTDDAAVT